MKNQIKEFGKLFHDLEYRHSRWNVWDDFLELSALAIANNIYHNDQLESEYMAIIKRYEPKEQAIFPKLLSQVVLGLDPDKGEYGDFLGTVFHVMELQNKWRGQFFTPYHLSLAMAQMNLGTLDKSKRIITISEPSCGSAGMCIACCEVAWKQDFDFQKRFFFHAKDVDRRCFNMAYIQLSLIGAPAIVELGDTLRVTTDRYYHTPAFFMAGFTDEKIKKVLCGEGDKNINITDPVQPFVAGDQMDMFAA